MKLFGINLSTGKDNQKKNSNIKIQNFSIIDIDFYYIKSILIFVVAVFSSYMYLNQNSNIDVLKNSNDSLTVQLKKENTKVEDLSKKVSKFESTVKNTKKIFLLDKDKFGIYKLMTELDYFKKIYDFSYDADEKATTINKNYFKYKIKFKIPYKNLEIFKETLNIITSKYFNKFIYAVYSKGTFEMHYEYYGKKEK